MILHPRRPFSSLSWWLLSLLCLVCSPHPTQCTQQSQLYLQQVLQQGRSNLVQLLLQLPWLHSFWHLCKADRKLLLRLSQYPLQEHTHHSRAHWRSSLDSCATLSKMIHLLIDQSYTLARCLSPRILGWCQNAWRLASASALKSQLLRTVSSARR